VYVFLIFFKNFLGFNIPNSDIIAVIFLGYINSKAGFLILIYLFFFFQKKFGTRKINILK
jgi:hypothetical protein